MKKIQDNHQKLMKHIQLMEDTVITLAEEEGEIESYESGLQIARKLVKKQKIK